MAFSVLGYPGLGPFAKSAPSPPPKKKRRMDQPVGHTNFQNDPPPMVGALTLERKEGTTDFCPHYFHATSRVIVKISRSRGVPRCPGAPPCRRLWCRIADTNFLPVGTHYLTFKHAFHSILKKTWQYSTTSRYAVAWYSVIARAI